MSAASRTAILLLALAPACAVGAEGPLDVPPQGTVIQSDDAATSQDVAGESQGTPGRDAASFPPAIDAGSPSPPEAGGGDDSSTGGDVAAMPPADSGAGTVDASADSPADAPSTAPESGPPPPPTDSGSACAGPMMPAGCHACSSSSSTCQPNGCYNGYVCDTMTNRCGAPGTCP